jgi:hypothetical protein
VVEIRQLSKNEQTEINFDERIQDHFLVLDIPATDAHWEDTTAILQFTNGFLRVVN